jgi:hypothetical protein
MILVGIISPLNTLVYVLYLVVLGLVGLGIAIAAIILFVKFLIFFFSTVGSRNLNPIQKIYLKTVQLLL